MTPPKNYSINMTVRSQQDFSLLQSTTHFTRAEKKVKEWTTLMNQFCHSSRDHDSIVGAYNISITIQSGQNEEEKLHSAEFKGQSTAEVNKWWNFMSAIAPEADERRL